MKVAVSAAAAVAALLATAVVADPVADLADGVGALNRHDDGAAVRLLSAALDSRMLSPANQEIALVRRAQAYLLLGRSTDALADARQALAMQPGDAEAERVRNYAEHIDLPAPHGPKINTDRSLNAAVAARDAAVTAELAASQANYQTQLAAYQRAKDANAQAYAAQMAAYQANVQAQQAQATAAQAAWQAAVKACKAGDRAQCAKR
jgi:tetratricopeptide (TPR) repeat protein